jgi:hypothetical protein
MLVSIGLASLPLAILEYRQSIRTLGAQYLWLLKAPKAAESP